MQPHGNCFPPSGKGAVYSFDPVGSYQRDSFKAGGSASAMLQPLLDNQVRTLPQGWRCPFILSYPLRRVGRGDTRHLVHPCGCRLLTSHSDFPGFVSRQGRGSLTAPVSSGPPVLGRPWVSTLLPSLPGFCENTFLLVPFLCCLLLYSNPHNSF